MNLTTEQLDTMQALEQAATPGPWEVITKGNSVRSFSIDGVCHGMKADGANAAFIAAARAFVPRAVEALRFTEASTREADAVLAGVTDEMTEADLRALIDMAAQKLRGVSLSPEDAEALELARKYPIELDYMQEGGSGE